MSTRTVRRAQVAAGALILALPATAAALSAGRALADGATDPTPLPAKVRSSHIGYGHDVIISGRTATASAGHTVALQYERSGARAWRPLASGTVARDGGFRLRAALRSSGSVRVVDQSAPAGQASAASAAGAQRVSVAASVHLRPRSVTLLGSGTVRVRGKLLSAVAGRRVRLEGRSGGAWRLLSTARTGRRGGFDLRFVARGSGTQPLRVRFAGDRLNAPAETGAGTATVLRQSQASWYSDGGTTGCGFHAHYGVANRTLPCGTKVTFYNAGHTVTAVVDDRGPYVGGRDWDLNQNTAAALGFGGVGTVWSSV